MKPQRNGLAPAEVFGWSRGGSRAFARIEALAVLAVLGLLTVTVLPTVAGTGGNAKALRCMSNLHRLTQGWLEYAVDNNDAVLSANKWIDGSDGDRSYMSWDSSGFNTNTMGLTNSSISYIAAYVNPIELIKCPADHYRSPANPGPRTRSVSLNMAMNASLFVLGKGLNTNRTFYGIAPYGGGLFNKLSLPVRNGLSRVMVFLDEHPDSIDDGIFALNVGNQTAGSRTWRNLPGSFHDGALSLSYADGHCELHPWQSQSMVRPVVYVYTPINLQLPDANEDFSWVEDRMPYR